MYLQFPLVVFHEISNTHNSRPTDSKFTKDKYSLAWSNVFTWWRYSTHSTRSTYNTYNTHSTQYIQYIQYIVYTHIIHTYIPTLTYGTWSPPTHTYIHTIHAICIICTKMFTRIDSIQYACNTLDWHSATHTHSPMKSQMSSNLSSSSSSPTSSLSICSVAIVPG